jgi:hypothetical protein
VEDVTAAQRRRNLAGLEQLVRAEDAFGHGAVGLSKDLGFPQPLVAFEWHLRARCAHLDFFLFLFLFV